MRTAVTLAGALAALVAAAAALAAASFPDPTGDNNAAPDLTAVAVSESADAVLTISLTIGNYQALPLESWVNLWFDLDSNRSTGDAGDEALVQYFDDGGVQLFRWNGSELVRRPATGIAGTTSAGVVTITVPKTSLDGASTFGFLAVAARGQEEPAYSEGEQLVASDFAPDAGRARYVGPGPLAFADPVADHDAAPDIARVDVSDTKAGLIRFAISTPSHQTLVRTTWMEVDFDLDRRRRTGDDGVEVYLGYEDGQVVVGRWDPGVEEFRDVPASGVRATNAGGVVTFDVPRRLLGDVASFDFYLLSGDSDPSGDEDNAVDLAPDGDAWWTYKLVYAPALHLVAGAPRGIPAQPVAGRRFSVVVPVTRSDTARGITSGSAACKVTVAGRNITAAGRVAAGTARCSLRVPPDAAGSTLRGTVLVRSGGKSVTTRFAFRVRR